MEKLNKEKQIAIGYHYPCFDGSYSAVNAFKYYENFSTHKNKISFFPLNSNNKLSEINLENYNKVYLLDRGINEEDLSLINANLIDNKNNLKFIIIDHHSSSIEYYKTNYQDKFKIFKNIKLIFDDTGMRSACGLTFEYFKNKSMKKYPIEKVEEIYDNKYKILNDYVEDSDVGKLALIYSNEFKSGLSSYLTPLKNIADFKTGLKFIKLFYEVDAQSIIRQGEKQYRKYKKNSKNEISGKNCFIVELQTKKFLNPEKWRFIACYTQNKQYRNYACPILSQISKAKGLSPIGGFIYKCEKNIYKMSMRTHSNEIDLGYICSQFGGGGHKTASAFSENRQFFDDIVISHIDLYKILQNFS